MPEKKKEITNIKPGRRKRKRRSRHIFRRTFVALLAAAMMLGVAGMAIYERAKKEKTEAVSDMDYSSDEVSSSIKERMLNRSSKNLNMLPVYAHRGLTENSLENSFASFDEAFNSLCPQIELDVQLSSDGVFYVVHDDTLTTVAEYDGEVNSMTSEELDQIKLTNGEKLHRLSEIFDRYQGQMLYLIEFKDQMEDVSPFVELMNQYPELALNVQIQSFHIENLQKLQEYFPNMFKQMLAENQVQIDQGVAADYIDSVAINKDLITADVVSYVHDAGKQIWAWTLKDTDEIWKLYTMDVDGVITDLSSAIQIAKVVKQNRIDSAASVQGE